MPKGIYDNSKRKNLFIKGHPNYIDKNNLKKYVLENGPWNKGKKCPQLSGSKNGNWKENKESKKYRMGSSWYQKQVLARDNHQCQVCLVDNIVKIDNLKVHHMIPYKINPHHNTENMITVCKECHDYIHTNDLVLRGDYHS